MTHHVASSCLHNMAAGFSGVDGPRESKAEATVSFTSSAGNDTPSFPQYPIVHTGHSYSVWEGTT